MKKMILLLTMFFLIDTVWSDGASVRDFIRNNFSSSRRNLPIASSNLPADNWGDYSVRSAFDNNIATSWSEGRNGAGIGEIIAFQLPYGTEVIRILPGYGASGTFQRNHRVKTANFYIYSFKWDNFEGYDFDSHMFLRSMQIRFEDKMELQDIQLPFPLLPQEYSDYVAILEITEVFRGSKYDDTCIAEIQTGFKKNTKLLIEAINRSDIQSVQNLAADVNLNHIWNQENDTPLSLAIKSGNLEIVEILLKSGSDPTLSGRGRPYSLHDAIHYMITAVPILVQFGADLNMQTDFGWTPLHVIASTLNDGEVDDYAEIVQQLVNSANLELRTHFSGFSTGGLRDDNHFTPLHFAARHNNYNFAKILIEAGADLNAASDYGNTPLHLALTEASRTEPELYQSLINLLVSSGAKLKVHNSPYGEAETALEMAKRLGLFSFLIESADGSDINYALSSSAYQGDISSVRDLIDNVGVNPDSAEALSWAAAANHFDLVKILVEDYKVDLNIGSPLVQAIGYSRWDIVDYLLGKGASFSQSGKLKNIANGLNEPYIEGIGEFSPVSITYYENHMNLPFSHQAYLPTNPVKRSQLYQDRRVAAVEILDDILYITSYQQGLEIFNISDPVSPEYKSRIDMNFSSYSYPDLSTSNSLLAAYDNAIIYVVDITIPDNPWIRATIQLGYTIKNVLFYDIYMIVAVHGKILVYDVSNPDNPDLKKELSISGYEDADMIENMLYTIGGNSLDVYQLDGQGNLIFQNSKKASEIGVPDLYYRKIRTENNYLFLTGIRNRNSLILNRSSFKLETEFDPGYWVSMHFTGETLFLGGRGGIRIYNFQNPETMIEIGISEDPQYSSPVINDINLDGSYLYSAGGDKGLLIYELK